MLFSLRAEDLSSSCLLQPRYLLVVLICTSLMSTEVEFSYIYWSFRYLLL